MKIKYIFKRNGFTLIEIMITLLIIGIITSVLIPNYTSIQNKSKENAVKSVCHTLQVALETHSLSTGGYPNSNLTITELATTLQNSDSLAKPPKNPFTNANYSNSDTSGKITYSYDTNTLSYTLHGYGVNNSKEVISLGSSENN